MNKKGEGSLLNNLMALAVIFGVLLWAGVIPGMSTTGTGTSGGTAGQPIQVEVKQGAGSCNVDTTTLSLNNYNKYVTSTALADGNSYWRLFSTDGSVRGDLGTFADGATKSISPGNNLVIYAGDNSSNRFVQKIDSFRGSGGETTSTTPCQGTLALIANLAPVDTTPTFVFKNANGEVNTGQDLGANNKYNYEIKLTATADQSAGNPYLAEQCKTDANACNKICFQHNTTVIDSVDLAGMKIAGANFATTKVGTPRAISNNLTGAGFTFTCWTFPSFDDGNEMIATAIIDTAATAPLSNNAVNTSLAYVDYGLHTDTKAEIIGVEDNQFTTLVTNTPVFLTQNPIDVN